MGVSQHVLAEQDLQAFGAVLRCRACAGPRRRRAWKASTDSMTSSASGFRYRWVVDRWAWPITHCRSVSGMAGSLAIR